MTDTPLARLVAALPEGSRLSRNGGGWTARCPAHDDRHSSLSIGEGRDNRVLLRCFAGCPAEKVVTALGLGLRDLFDGRRGHDGPQRRRTTAPQTASRPESTSSEPQGRFDITEEDVARWHADLLANQKVVERLAHLRGWNRDAIERLGLGLDGDRATFPIRDAAGDLVGLLRYAPNPDKRDGPKMLAALCSRRELFPAPETLNGDGPLWLVEGEADCVTATSVGLPASGLPGVAIWRPEWAPRFAGRRIVIALDCDKEGRKAAQRVAADLVDVAAEVRVLDLDPGRNDGHDLSDIVLAGLNGSREPEAYASAKSYLLDLAANAPVEAQPRTGTAGLLASVEDFYRRFVSAGDDELCALTLWTAHAHAVDAADTTPYMHITSAEKASGKTRVLEVASLLVPRPMEAANISDAALFRAVAAERVTVLMDEVDTVFGSKAREREDLRGLLNAGYRRGQSAYRMGGAKRDELQRFEVFGAKMLAGIGDLPDTLASRCVRIRMERRTASEPVERLRARQAGEEAEPVRGGLEAWAAANVGALRDARPDIPDELGDRLADAWEPLLAIADLAGGDWPERARAAAVHLAGRVQETTEESTGIRLLTDIRGVFDRRGCDRIATQALLEALAEDEEAPWGDWRGGPIRPKALAGILRRYGIKSRNIRLADGATPKGFLREQFEEPWGRYLASTPSPNATTPQASIHAGLSPIPKRHATPLVADGESAANPHGQTVVAGVAGKTPKTGAESVTGASGDTLDARPAEALHAPPSPEQLRRTNEVLDEITRKGRA